MIERLAQDLRSAFPTMKGFSRANLMYMGAFAEAWPDEAIVQQAVGQIPWGHNLVLLTKLKTPEQRLAMHGVPSNMASRPAPIGSASRYSVVILPTISTSGAGTNFSGCSFCSSMR